MSKKHVNSRDPRKAKIIAALKRKSGGTKVTNVTETVEHLKGQFYMAADDGSVFVTKDNLVIREYEKDIKVFSGDCMRLNKQGNWDRLGTFHVQESEIA